MGDGPGASAHSRGARGGLKEQASDPALPFRAAPLLALRQLLEIFGSFFLDFGPPMLYQGRGCCWILVFTSSPVGKLASASKGVPRCRHQRAERQGTGGTAMRWLS